MGAVQAAKILKLKGELVTVRAELKTRAARIATLETNQATDKQTIKALEQQVTTLTNANTTLTTENASLTTTNQSLSSQVTDLTNELTQANQEIATLEAELNPPPTPTPTPTPTPVPTGLISNGVGVYNGGPSYDADTKSEFGAFPAVSSEYLFYNSDWASVVAQFTASMKNGTVALVDYDVRTSTITLTDIATSTTAGLAAIDAFIDNVVVPLSAVGTVVASLCHESDVKVNNGTYSDTAENAGKAQQVFIARVRSKAPNAKVIVWLGDPTSEKNSDTVGTTILGQITSAPDFFGVDPDTAGARGTFAAVVGPPVKWLQAQSAYATLGKPPIVLPEFGLDTAAGDTACAAFYTDLPTSMAALGLVWVVFFNRNSGSAYDFCITGGSFPLSVAAFSASMT